MTDKQFKALTNRVRILEELLHTLGDAPGKNNETGIRPHGAPSKKANAASGQPATTPQIPPSPSNTDQTKHPWYKTLDGWKAVVELIAIPFAIGYAVVTYLQWRDLRHNFTTDERSLIEFKPKNDTMPVSAFDSAYIPIDMANIGKTPARKVEVLSNAEVLDRQAAPSFNYNNGRQATTYLGLLFPNMPLDVHAGTYTPLSEQERRNLESGKAYIVGYAIVTWEDTFGTSHWMHFCARHTFSAGTSNAKTCSDYNDTDNN